MLKVVHFAKMKFQRFLTRVGPAFNSGRLTLNESNPSRVRGSGCTVIFRSAVGKSPSDPLKKWQSLSLLKVVPSVLFLKNSECQLYIECELSNPTDRDLEVSNVVLEILPKPSSYKCKTDLFKETDSQWPSMFYGYKFLNHKNDRSFTYKLWIDKEDIKDEKDRKEENASKINPLVA